MADHEHRGRMALQPPFKPHQCVKVQMVRGFVQQQQVGRTHQCARQLKPHAPSAREAVDRSVQLLNGESQAHEQCLGAGPRIEAARLRQGRMRFCHRMAVMGCFSLCQRLARRHQGFVAFQHEIRGTGVRLGHVLGHFPDAPLPGQVDVAAVRIQAASQCREQAGFAGTVAPHEPHFLSGVERDVGAVEHQLRASAQGELSQCDHARRPVQRPRAWAGKASTESPPLLFSSHSGSSPKGPPNRASKCDRS